MQRRLMLFTGAIATALVTAVVVTRVRSPGHDEFRRTFCEQTRAGHAFLVAELSLSDDDDPSESRRLFAYRQAFADTIYRGDQSLDLCLGTERVRANCPVGVGRVPLHPEWTCLRDAAAANVAALDAARATW